MFKGSFGRKEQTSSLAYKKEDQDGTDGEGEDQEELDIFSIIGRIVVFPFVVPVFMVYILFFARGTPIASELDNIDDNSDDEYGSEDDYHTPMDMAIMMATDFYKTLCCVKSSVSTEAAKDTLSFDAFMSIKKPEKPRAKQFAYEYEPVTDVGRTDRVEYAENGVFVKNIWVPIDDVATLEALLLDIEKQALQEEGAWNDGEEEQDEWEQRMTAKGEAKKVLRELLAKAKRGEGVHTHTLSADARARARVDKPTAASPVRPAHVGSQGSPEQQKAPTSSGKKSKPRKAPVPEDTPLAERMNARHVQNMPVDGPSVDMHTGAGGMAPL